MSSSYFTLVSRDGSTARFGAAESTAGPWAPGLQHGGPPNALAVWMAEQEVVRAVERTDLVALRISSDFVGPVPVAPIEVHAEVVRSARSAALVDVVVSDGSRDCLRSQIWFVRDTDTSGIARALAEPCTVPDVPPGIDNDFGYGRSLEWRFVEGGLTIAGPGVAWVRPRTALLDDVEMSGLSRTVLVADSASGISAELDWTRWSFVNVDLDVHLARPPEDDWVLVQATTQLGAHGSGLARSTLSDRRGVVGGSMQTLVLAPSRPAPTSR